MPTLITMIKRGDGSLGSKDQAEPSSTCESALALAFYLPNHYANILQFPAKTLKEPNPPAVGRPQTIHTIIPNPQVFFLKLFYLSPDWCYRRKDGQN